MRNKASVKELRTLGRNIHRLRNEAGLSQDELALKADLTKRYIQMMESGRKCPTLVTLKRLKTALGCRYEHLLSDF